MFFSRVFTQLAGVLSIAAALSACDQSQPVGQPLAIEGETVATVNGVAIKEPELQALIEGRGANGQTPGREQALNELVDMELLRQKAVSEGLHQKTDVAVQVNRSATNALISGFIRNLIDSQPISDEDLKAEYEKRFGAASSTEYKSRHILSESEEDALANIKALEEGADFGELAKEKSTGPSASQGGDLGWSSPNNYVAEFSTALQELEPGDYTKEPVKTRFGWHVIKLEDTRESGGPDIERLKPQLERALINQRLQEYVANLKEKADVQIVGETAAADTEAAKADTETEAAGEGENTTTESDEAASPESTKENADTPAEETESK